jgi:hypothetical protein
MDGIHWWKLTRDQGRLTLPCWHSAIKLTCVPSFRRFEAWLCLLQRNSTNQPTACQLTPRWLLKLPLCSRLSTQHGVCSLNRLDLFAICDGGILRTTMMWVLSWAGTLTGMHNTCMAIDRFQLLEAPASVTFNLHISKDIYRSYCKIFWVMFDRKWFNNKAHLIDFW